MNTLPQALSKTYWEDRHRRDLAALAELTGKPPAEVEADLSTPDAHARAEPVVVAQCDHDADTNGTDAEHLKILNNGRRRDEIYRCECGALIDYAHADNYGPPYRPMTAEEVTQAIREVVNKTNPA